MKQTLETYFVETHEYNFETSNCDLLEYFEYTFGDAVVNPNHLSDLVHHTILTLALI